MITAKKLKILTTLSAATITVAVDRKEFDFTGARFLGLTNGGQFCYSVDWAVNGEHATGKVFFSYDPAKDHIAVDMQLISSS